MSLDDGDDAQTVEDAMVMQLWRYKAVPVHLATGSATVRTGELAAASAHEARALLRRTGLQVIDIRPVETAWEGGSRLRRMLRDVSEHEMVLRYLRRRRRAQRAELYDSVATLLNAGLPLTEAITTVRNSVRTDTSRLAKVMTLFARRQTAFGLLLTTIHESLRDGSSIDDAMEPLGSWFSPVDVALVRSAVHSGTLPDTLASMAEREQRAEQVGHHLISALAYPCLVLLAAIGVVIFLSVRTLPSLTQMLVDADVSIPVLTNVMMHIGRFLAHYGIIVLLLGFLCSLIGSATAMWWIKNAPATATRVAAFLPRVTRTRAVADLASTLAHLLKAGVPLVEAMRVTSPATPVFMQPVPRAVADRIEQGEDLSTVLEDHPAWFTAEFCRLLETSEHAGDLDVTLNRIADRYYRTTRRSIDRLTAVLEPIAIIIVACLVGTVVMAAVLPLIQLQEVIK